MREPSMRHNLSKHMKRAALGIFVALISATSAQGEDPKAKRVIYLPRPAYEGEGLSEPIEGAQKLHSVPMREWTYGLRPITPKLWETKSLNRESIWAVTEALAEELLLAAEMIEHRNEKKVLTHLELRSDDPFFSAVLYAPSLRLEFADFLGDAFYLIPIEKTRFYLLPALSRTLEREGEKFVREYQDAKSPLALEVFLITKEARRAIGELQQ